MANEVWKPIPSFPGYEASSRGRIRSKYRIRVLQTDDDGYLTVGLYRDSVQVCCRVNVLVCEAFHGPKKYSFLHAAHRNGVKTNNRPTNVYWATPKQNMADQKRHGTRIQGVRHPFSTFTESQISIIRAQYRNVPKPATIKRLAEANMVTPATIRNIVKGRSWAMSFRKKGASNVRNSQGPADT